MCVSVSVSVSEQTCALCLLQGLPFGASDVNGRLTIRSASASDDGQYVCSAIGVPGDHRATATLIVDSFSEWCSCRKHPILHARTHGYLTHWSLVTNHLQ